MLKDRDNGRQWLKVVCMQHLPTIVLCGRDEPRSLHYCPICKVEMTDEDLYYAARFGPDTRTI